MAVESKTQGVGKRVRVGVNWNVPYSKAFLIAIRSVNAKKMKKDAEIKAKKDAENKAKKDPENKHLAQLYADDVIICRLKPESCELEDMYHFLKSYRMAIRE